MNMARFLGFVIAGGLWEAIGRERAHPLISRGAERLVDIGEELIEGYKGGMAGASVGSSAARRGTGARAAVVTRTVVTRKPKAAPAKPRATAAATTAPKPKGRPPSQATMDKRRKEAQLEALARGRETRKKNLAEKKAAGPRPMPQIRPADLARKAEGKQ